MDITQIENLLSALCSEAGYDPVIASEKGIENRVDTMPTAWIKLPQVLYVEGRKEGIIGHKVTLILIEDYKGHSFEDQAKRLSQMQNDAIEIMTGLSLCEGVVEIANMTVSSRVLPTTRHDNIAQVCEATIVTYF